ncbi:unnamed protein product [Oppiella nova]|uniref:Insulin-like domain-containing protein n=1 Tax=Oppiella nova TaxID=334625 RepID=A0A7R9QWD1_9ACAR|nr:unnamed protein product [Oppiella nova]CAG2178033.1 unnamed protein product [Oppiella nova]
MVIHLNIWTIMSLVLISICDCNPGHGHRSQGTSDSYFKVFGYLKLERHLSMRLCGKPLAEALTVACPNNTFNNKRSNKMVDFSDYSLPEEPTPDVLELTKSMLQEMVTENPYRFHRNIRTVHEDCCQKSCTFAQIEEYCNSTSTHTRPNNND